MRSYSMSNGSFSYPENWQFDACTLNNRLEFKLPGYMRVNHQGNSRHRMAIEGFSSTYCTKGTYVIKTEPWTGCVSSFKNYYTEKLSNGFYLAMDKSNVRFIEVYPKDCTHPIFEFSIASAERSEGLSDEMRKEPAARRGQLINSPQYKDIVKFAESIKIQE